MAFSSTGSVGDLDIGTYLKIYSTNGVYNNLSEASDMWKMMLKKRVMKPEGREVRYLLRSEYGPAAVKGLAPGAEGAFPAHQRTNQVEASAYFKDFGATIDVPRHLLNKTGSELAQYADPLAEELDAKGIVMARILSQKVTGNGSGTLGLVSGAPSVSTANDTITVTLNTATANAGYSHIGWFEYGDRCVFADPDGTEQTTTNNTGTTVGYWQVVTRNDDNDTVTFKPYTAAGAAIDITSATIGATDPDDTDYIYRADEQLVDLNPTSGITDWGLASFWFPGLESLAADDSRVVNGLTMEGAISGSRFDAGGAAIDRTHFQSLLSKIKRRVGKNRYKYNAAYMFDTTYDNMLESWETDRQIISVSDNKRGAPQLGFIHHKDTVMFEPDEFVQKGRIFICPEGDVLQYRGTDIERVDVGGQKFFMPSNASSADRHQRAVRAYLEGSGLLFAVHPAAIGVLENFV